MLNVPSITLNELKEVIALAYETRQPIFIFGSPGIGKSQVIAEFARGKNLPLLDIRTAGRDPSDIAGYHFVQPKDNKLVHYLPEEWPTDPESKGIIFYDELADASKTVQNVCYSVLLDRQMNNRPLPDGWWVCAAGNTPEDGSMAEEISTALSDRCIIVKVRADVETYLQWAGTRLRPEVVAFLKLNPEHLDNNEQQVRDDNLVGPTPRSWDAVSKILDSAEKNSISPRGVFFTLAGKLGQAVATEFSAYLADSKNAVPIEEYFKATSKEQIKDLLPTSLNIFYYFIYGMIQYVNDTPKLKRAFLILDILCLHYKKSDLPGVEIALLGENEILNKAFTVLNLPCEDILDIRNKCPNLTAISEAGSLLE